METLTPEVATRLRLSPETTGVFITEVAPGSAAEDANLVQGDIITEVAQQDVLNTEEFLRLVEEHAVPGKSLLIGFIRRDGEQDITVIRVPKAAGSQ